MRKHWMLAGLLLLTACQTVPRTGDAARLYTLKPGAVLRLNRAVTMPAGSATVYLQDGRLRSYGTRDLYRPNCEFMVRTVADKPREIRPGDFRITRVVHGTDYFASNARVAGLGIEVGFGGSPANMYNFVTELMLHSRARPDVLKLSCAQVADYSIGEYLSLRDFQLAVGKYFTLIP